MKSQYDVERINYKNLNGSVVLPSYQRRLVWSDTQKKAFIENISRGYPFGSILLYRYEGDKKLSLIDGLQRYSTLTDYEKNPAKYFNDLEGFSERLINNIEQHRLSIGVEEPLSDSAREDLSLQFTSMFKEFLESEDDDPFYLEEKITSEVKAYPTEDEYTKDIVRLQTDLKKAANSYLDLDELVIPCVVFTGDESELPDVFANLNQGGTKLTKYQVLAAHWTRHDFTLGPGPCSSSILGKVIDRYVQLEATRELKIEGFESDLMEQSRRINLSEYCYALGGLIAEQAPVFWQTLTNSDADKSKSEDTINVLGYLSTAIALGVDNRAINKLPEKFEPFKVSEKFIEELTELILKEYAVIQGEFEKWLRKPDNKEEYESGAVTEMQVLSFFASLWHHHYTVDFDNCTIEPIVHYKDYGYEAIRRNLVAYCVLDAASHHWQGSGDSRLANYYVKNTGVHLSYSLPPSYDTINSRLLMWLDEASQKGSVNLEKISKLLLCIYTSIDRTKYGAGAYDIEHVIAKKRLKDNNVYVSESVPGGTLGNLMYLSSGVNRAKKEFNLYDLQQKIPGVRFEPAYLDLIQYPSQEQMINAEQALKRGDGSAARNLIEGRAKAMINAIAKALSA